MAKIYMVRHGKAAAGFERHLDPGLDTLGHKQAAVTANHLAELAPMPIYSSPLARARETAQPLAALWQAKITIEPRVAEIPSPTTDLGERSAWLRTAMSGRWSDLQGALQVWRDDLVGCLLALTQDSVIYCHFIAINAAVGAAQGDDRLVVFAPDNGSVTTLRNDVGALELLDLGQAAETSIN